MIIGYVDTDVSVDSRFQPYLFNVENNDTPIDWLAVEAWYIKLNEQPNRRQTLAMLASDVLSMNTKAKRYLDFLDDLSQ
jgi:hypothetical protein